MKIRQAVMEDIPAIMGIESVSFADQIQENIDTFKKRVSVFPDGFYVLEIEGTVYGYFASEIWEDSYFDRDSFILDHDIAENHNNKGTVLYVSSVAILPEIRGKGIGQHFFNECMKKVLDLYPKICKSVLIVNENWYGAKHIYCTYGFKVTDCLKSFFFDGDAIVMSLDVAKGDSYEC